MNARRQLVRFVLPLILTLAVASPSLAQSQARIIVKLRDAGAKSAATAKARTEKLARLAGTPLRHVREMALGADVVIADLANEAEGERIAARLAADTDVAFAQVDHRVHARQAQLPVNDVFAAQQHYLDNDATSVSVYAAWEVTHGSPGIVVAVVDSGYRPHAGMAGRILPGYDMISDPDVANDGDGRDADASDPGDWVSADEATSDCPAHRSFWHGTSVAGIIAANTNDASTLKKGGMDKRSGGR